MTATATENTTSENTESNKPSYDDLNIPVIVLIGAISAVVTYVMICFLQGLFYFWDDAIETKRQNYETSPYQAQFDDQLEGLTLYRKAKDGKVAIPIGNAMDKVVEKFAATSAKPDDHGAAHDGDKGHDEKSHDEKSHDAKSHDEKEHKEESKSDDSDSQPKAPKPEVEEKK